ncbi:unannotated protein [freshwater metagenome]|uniref:Unannotated protein n=1 Tax=freshwater metagenome TaxID=449393 RepID=A0A6J6HYF2_9ZZZZ|nr:CPBP family intramembrane metalloprotease [Actinomycetota bacterium]
MTHSTSGRPSALSVWIYWFGAFIVANFLSIIALSLCGSNVDPVPTWVVTVGALSLWCGYVVMTLRYLHVDVRGLPQRLQMSVRTRDVFIGAPLGIASQLILVNVVNWPLSRLFPNVFSFDDISQRASDLVDNARGGWIVALVLVVVVGAPLIEEMVYRGVVQPGLVSAWGPMAGIVTTAALFAAVHLQPIEFPGLFVFALVLGFARHRSDRLALSIVAHMAFNTTGLALVMLT